MVTSREREGERGKIKVIKRHKLLCTKYINYKDMLYSTENIANIF